MAIKKRSSVDLGYQRPKAVENEYLIINRAEVFTEASAYSDKTGDVVAENMTVFVTEKHGAWYKIITDQKDATIYGFVHSSCLIKK